MRIQSLVFLTLIVLASSTQMEFFDMVNINWIYLFSSSYPPKNLEKQLSNQYNWSWDKSNNINPIYLAFLNIN